MEKENLFVPFHEKEAPHGRSVYRTMDCGSCASPRSVPAASRADPAPLRARTGSRTLVGCKSGYAAFVKRTRLIRPSCWGARRALTRRSPAIPEKSRPRFSASADAPPAHLQRVPGPKTILSFLQDDPEMQALKVPLPRSTRIIWKILRKHDRILSCSVRRSEALERPDPLIHWQIDFKDASTVPADPFGKQSHVIEILNIVAVGTSMVLESHVQPASTRRRL